MNERDVERVLHKLGAGIPPEGMERRILARLDEVERKAGAWWTRTGWMAMRGVALAGVMVLAGMLPMVHRMRGGVSVKPLLREKLPEESKASRLEPLIGEAEIRVAEAPRSLPRSEGGLRLRASEPRGATAMLAGPGLRESSDGLEADWSAGNHPAPPIPLTDQERLLVRLAHRGDPQELAKLNSEAQMAQSAAEIAEFKEFFVQPDFLVKPKMEDNQ